MKGFFLSLVLILLIACGPSGVSPVPIPRGDIVVTEKDHSATIQVGKTLTAVLRANSGLTNWANVQSSNPAVLAPQTVSSQGTGQGQAITVDPKVTIVSFTAVSIGQAKITAVAGALCSPGLMCPMYAILLSIDVSVIA